MNQKTINRRYRIDRLIGEGGMAEVYLGHDLLLNRPVAIKMLRQQYARDPNFRARFEREAQAAASFTHPNIIDIYDVGEEGETPYIVMEYGAGDNLQQIIETEGPFEPDDVAALIEQVASALDYAHERGFVHRDIKPQNILVDEQGLAKVVDFGIAKSLADTDLTVAGTGLGTVHYVSPEQASGLMATPSSDIYSLAVVAYEMLAGQLPFDADTPVGIAMQHVNEPPPNPSKLNPAVPKQVSDIILKGLAKDPTKRFPTASTFASALTNWRTGKASSGLKQTSRATAANRTTVAMPQAQGQPSGQRRVADTWVGGPGVERTSPRTEREQASGCTSWVVGALVLAAVGALLWFGFSLSDRLRDLDNPNPTSTFETESTATAEPTSAGPEPTVAGAEPTSPAIVPNDGQEAVNVPDVRNQTVEEARAALEPLGLLIEETGESPSDDVPADQIIDQIPLPGDSVEPGTTVQVTVSSGPETVNIADMNLFGLPADQAQSMLEARGLTVQRQEQSSTETPEGTVIDTEPADVAQQGDTVVMFVSMGDNVQIPPDIQGSPRENAAARLEQLGFEVSNEVGVDRARIEQFGVDLEAAGIVDQDVVGVQNEDNTASFGAWLPPGSAIEVVYYDESLNESE